jgi:hypothetical protein
MSEYKQVKISVDPAVAAAFKIACSAAGVSMASELSRFMRSRAGELESMPARDAALDRVSTRGLRRKAVKAVIARLERIRDAEESYCGRIPENLAQGSAFEAAEQAVSDLEQAINLLSEAF